ncbi:acetyl-coenzyme A transporter 1 isoform X2 [Anabrus simplex]|uniref:acetyl-coenzyme A transporter 1 isoform X2 n=1 Tax=Anabrus simplex TaxID=316456 RepID=UPI0035A337FE
MMRIRRRRDVQDYLDPPRVNMRVTGDIRGDEKNVFILFLLYLLQGIPLGLCAAIPMYLQSKHVSYRSQANFSFATWPFSLKLLWAPIVDSIYIQRFGRRKSWLIPSQYLIGIFMIFLSRNVDELLGVCDKCWFGVCTNCTDPDILKLTGYFFILSFLAATQDIAVDGWALTMLRRCNVGYASTCNSVGQTAGYFLGYVLFISLESADFCNKYLRSTPQSVGLITLSGFLLFWGVAFLITTTVIAFVKKEHNPSPRDPHLGIRETYSVLWKILKLPAIQAIMIVLLTSKIGYSACDAVASLKLIESGIPKETLASLSLPLVPFQIILPFLVSKFLVGPHPMTPYLKAVPYRLGLCLWVAVLVGSASSYVHNGVVSTFFIAVVLVSYLFIQLTVNVMFVSVMAFFAQISDPAVGGTYMTLLNTINNLGGNWPSTLALWVVETLTFRFCWDENVRFICKDDDCAARALGCVGVDGYYVETVVCFLIGIVWLLWAKKKIRDLQNRRAREWKIYSHHISEV